MAAGRFPPSAFRPAGHSVSKNVKPFPFWIEGDRRAAVKTRAGVPALASCFPNVKVRALHGEIPEIRPESSIGRLDMRYRSHRMRKPDPLLLLALIVGLGVVVTTAAQAAGPEERAVRAEGLYAAGTRLMLDPRKGLAERIAPHWLNNLLERPAVRQLIEKRGGAGRPFGAKGPEFVLSLRPVLKVSAEEGGDHGIGGIPERRPDLYIGLSSHW